MFTCKRCNDTFTNKGSYMNHFKRCKDTDEVSIYTCECGKEFDNSYAYAGHRGKCLIAHPDLTFDNYKGRHWHQESWSKGLTKETDPRLMNLSKALIGKTPHPWSEESRMKMSESMKKAHAEGRAATWQDTKKFHEMSYPEYFFSEVIKNHFTDKNYIQEFRVKQYAIDFAWVEKKLAIEIDGQQHEREEYWRISDARKDALLISLGWKVLRIRWIDLFHEPQKFIELARKFVDDT